MKISAVNYAIFYSADRRKILQVGQQIELVKDYSVLLPSGQSFFPDSDLEDHLNDLFPEGLSVHGFQYLLNSNCLFKDNYNKLPVQVVEQVA
ncbi:hypothetical protein Cylst_3009 [Cylindrospermum stagnale PCC 7417]|uniref:Uncharacterized protein n=1 Tax=Cylindrospermum stagnale PCC 7417 TaxID=56107 RepID=K9WXU1_9NOST|nr:hypothetical protein [Cylindrospermum stagnale]AFZ25180.1 hypothetical protein Cylst_3009 [Cylindrospermum stagnale PCC 7417]